MQLQGKNAVQELEVVKGLYFVCVWHVCLLVLVCVDLISFSSKYFTFGMNVTPCLDG